MSYNNNSSLWMISIGGILAFLGVYYGFAKATDKMIEGGSSTKKRRHRHRHKNTKTKKH
jgi:hypothetical protein